MVKAVNECSEKILSPVGLQILNEKDGKEGVELFKICCPAAGRKKSLLTSAAAMTGVLHRVKQHKSTAVNQGASQKQRKSTWRKQREKNLLSTCGSSLWFLVDL